MICIFSLLQGGKREEGPVLAEGDDEVAHGIGNVLEDALHCPAPLSIAEETQGKDNDKLTT